MQHTIFIAIIISLSVSAAHASENLLKKFRQQAYFTEHSIDAIMLNNKPGEIFNLAAFNEEFEKRKKMNAKQMYFFLEEGGKDLSELNKIAEALENLQNKVNLPEIAQAIVNVGSVHTANPAVQKGVAIFDEAVNISSGITNVLLGSNTLSVAQSPTSSPLEFLSNIGRHEINKALEYADKDPEYRNAFNKYFASKSKIGVTTDASAEQILSLNKLLPVYTLANEDNKLLAIVDKNISIMTANSKVGAQVGAQEIENFISNGNDLVAGVVQNSDAVLNLMRDLEKKDLEEQTTKNKAQELSLKRKQLDQSIKDAQDAVNLTTIFLGFVDKKSAHDFSIASNAVINISQQIGRFNLSKGMSGILLTTNVASEVLNFMSIFDDKGLSQYNLFLKQFDRISNQIKDLDFSMRSHFSALDQKIGKVYDAMINGLSNIKKDIVHVHERIGDIKNQIIRTQQQIERLGEDLNAKLEALSQETKNVKISDCLRYRIRASGKIMPFETLFYPCLSSFYVWSTKWSKDPNHIGTIHNEVTSLESLKNPDLMARIMKDLNERPLDRLNLLSRIANLFDNKDITQPGTVVASIPTWVLGSEAYLQVLNDWKQHYSNKFDPQCDLKEMIQTGKELRVAVQNIAFSDTANKKRENFFEALVSYYKKQTNILHDVFWKIEDEYRKEHGIDNNQLGTVDFWGPPYQTFSTPGLQGLPSAYQPKKPFAEWQGGFQNNKLRLNLNGEFIDKFVPNEWFVAESLGLVDIYFRWSLHGKDNPGGPKAPLETEHEYRGRRGYVLIGISNESYTLRGFEAEKRSEDQGNANLFPLPPVTFVLRDIPKFKDTPFGDTDYRNRINEQMADYVLANWISGDRLSDRFLNEAENAFDWSPHVNPLVGTYWFYVSLPLSHNYLDLEMSRHRKALASSIVKQIHDNNQKIADALTIFNATRTILRTFIEVEMSNSLAKKEQLAAALYGINALYSGEEIREEYLHSYETLATDFDKRMQDIMKTRKDRWWNVFTVYPKTLEGLEEWKKLAGQRYDYIESNPKVYLIQRNGEIHNRADNLLKIIDTILGAHQDEENLQIIERTLARLETTKAAWKGKKGKCHS